MNDTYDIKMVVEGGSYVSYTTLPNGWDVVNETNLPDNVLLDAVDFLSGYYPEISSKPMIVFKDKDTTRFCGYAAQIAAFFPRSVPKGLKGNAARPIVVIYCPTNCRLKYPATSVYKKRGGFQTYASWLDEMGNVLSHELRHVEQYSLSRKAGLNLKVWGKRFCKSGSVEVDAEFYARKNAADFRREFGIAAPTKAGYIVTRGVRLSFWEKQQIEFEVAQVKHP